MENDVKHGRRWRNTNYPLEFKRKLAQQACEPGVSVAQLALQHSLNANMVFKWRRELRTGQFDQAGLVAVTLATIAPSQSGVSDQRCEGVIEIRLGNATMRIERSARSSNAGGGLGRATSMICLLAGTRIWLAAGVTDMRSGFNGLASKVQTALE